MASKFIPYGLHSIDQEDLEEVVNVLRSDWIVSGPRVEAFERELCRYIGCKFAIAVNSGTAALDIAVQALNLQAGSQVVTTPFTFVATSNAVLYNGLQPVFADIERQSRNINPVDIRKKLDRKTKAIIYVDYAGHPCDIKAIREIANEQNLYLIEDAAHALGAEYEGKKVGSFADMTILSFHPVKQITTGEGGAVVTNNEEFYEKLKMLRNHGIDKAATDRFGPRAGWTYDLKLLGRNYRLTDFQAALGISQLKKLDGFIERRSEIAKTYNQAFKDTSGIDVPLTEPNVKHAWHIYTVLLDNVDRNLLFAKLKEKNIGANVHYIPIYRFSYYKQRFAIDPRSYPVTEEVFEKIITLPLFPKMSKEDVLNVVNIVQTSVNELMKST